MVRSLILKKQNWGEADELVVFLTRDLGWLSGVAKNSRKSRVRFGGHLEPFTLADLTLRPRKRDDLVWIEDAHVAKGFMRIRSDLARTAWCAYFLELASMLMHEANPDRDVFDFVISLLETLEAHEVSSLRLMLDEIRLLALLGYGPRFDACPVCEKAIEQGIDALFSPRWGGACHPACVTGGDEKPRLLSPDTLAVVRRGLEVEPHVAERLRLNRKGLEELRHALSAFARHIRGKEINSLKFLEAMALW